MAAKPKKYTGNVQFDIWGNLAEYDNSKYNNKVQVTADNFDNGQIVWDQWDGSARGYTKVPVFYTPDELEFVPYAIPQSRYGGSTVYIGEMNNYVTVPNFEFQDVLEYDDYGKSSYSTHFYMKAVHGGRKYRVFLKDLDLFIKEMNRGVMAGTFTFCKRGEKFGLKPVV